MPLIPARRAMRSRGRSASMTGMDMPSAGAARGKSNAVTADLWAGLAAMLVALPSSIAYGVAAFTAAGPGLAGAGALTGILGAVALGLTAPLVGRNAGFISAPCAPAAAVLAGLAAELAATGDMSTERILALLAVTAAMSAVLQMVYGAAGAGTLMKYIPYQVVTGYLSGVAVIIFTGQMPKLLGVSSQAHFFEAVTSPALWQWQGIVVGAATIAVTVLAPRVTRRVPAVILGLAAGIVVYFLLAAAQPALLQVEGNPLVIGPIQATGSVVGSAVRRFALLGGLSVADLGLVLAPALTLSALLSIDTLKTGVVLDALTRRRHDSNRELVAQGMANIVSFGVGGMPGAGTMGASLVNVTAGSGSVRSSLFEGMLALAAVLVFGKLIAWVPIGALAGILLVVSWRMFDFDMFRLARHRDTRLDFVVIVAVIIVAEPVGLIQASVVGVSLAIMLFIRDQVRGSVIVGKRDLTEVRSRRRRTEPEAALLDAHGAEALLVQLQDDLFFGTTDQILSDLEQDLGTRRHVLVDLRRVRSMDFTAAHLFEQMRYRLTERGGALLICGMPSSGPGRQDIERYLARLGVLGEGGVQVFETRDRALQWMEDQVLEAAGWIARDADPPRELGQLAFLRGLDTPSLARIRAIADARVLEEGERLFARGDGGDELYLVRKGRVSIRLPLAGGKHHHLATVGPGEMFGELAFLDRDPRSADAVAVIRTDLYALSRARLDALQGTDATLAARLFERVAREISQRLRIADMELRSLEER
ncbi:MAG: cyclic nucleotide-binding domain-containing protein [Gemmatimonadetes bacterium]|nr:cyclic nucleotide-binding domain-containing protein [Gemmatimonadota bacterium]